MYSLCEELEFRTILDMLKREWAEPDEVKPPGPKQGTRVDRVIRTREELAELVGIAQTKSLISIETETTSQDAMNADLVSIALCWEDNLAWYIPVGHSPEGGIQLNAAEALQGLDPVLSAKTPAKAGHNLKFQWTVLKRYGIELEAMVFDTMIASYLLDPGGQTHGLERISAEHLGEAISSYEEITGRGKSQVSFAEIDFDTATCYACGDVETCWRLVPVLRRKLDENKLMELYESIELPLTEVLARMEYRGILVDSEKLEELSIEFEKALDQKAALIYQLAGEEFNIQSPKQLGYILFDKLGLRVVKKTKSGPSTDTSVLEEISLEHPVAEQVLSYRTLSKLKGTYADALAQVGSSGYRPHPYLV